LSWLCPAFVKSPITGSVNVLFVRVCVPVRVTTVRLITDGGIGIRIQQFNKNAVGSSFEIVLEGQLFTILDPDTSPSVSNTIDVTVGTDIAPALQFVWTEITGGIPTMTSSTIGFPMTGDFAVVGTFLLQSQATVLADGPYADQVPNNSIFDSANRGHLSHINDRITNLDASYNSGIVITVVPAVGGGTAAEVTYSSTEGRAFELHLTTIQAFDLAVSGSIATIPNEGTQVAGELLRIVNIGTDLIGLTCANGTTVIGNNDVVNLVLFTVHVDSDPEQTNYGVNLPVDVYAAGAGDQDAIDDTSNFAIRNVPLSVRGISLLIAEVVVKITGGAGTFEILAVKDLRGQIPGAAGGAGGGGGGATDLNSLSDVTLNSPALDNILIFDGAGQWRNDVNPAGILLQSNLWADFQDYKTIADPGAGTNTDVRFFSEVIDANNTALFCYL